MKQSEKNGPFILRKLLPPCHALMQCPQQDDDDDDIDDDGIDNSSWWSIAIRRLANKIWVTMSLGSHSIVVDHDDDDDDDNGIWRWITQCKCDKYFGEDFQDVDSFDDRGITNFKKNICYMIDDLGGKQFVWSTIMNSTF